MPIRQRKIRQYQTVVQTKNKNTNNYKQYNNKF